MSGADDMARVTTLCRAWALERADGLMRGFTDHDRPLAFEGIDFRPETGLSAAALAQGAGLAPDTSEALGAISDAGISEAEIEEGRLDAAEIRLWRLDWTAPENRQLVFRGHLGEIRREGGLFRAELRGLSERLNRPLGRVYQPRCDASLGDARCGVVVAAHAVALRLAQASGARLVVAPDAAAPAPGGWAGGRVEILDGPGAGLIAPIRADRLADAADAGLRPGQRIVDLWVPPRVALQTGQELRLWPGCDKRAETCRLRFDNFLNFRGFPHLPGEDWLMAVPRGGGA